VGVNGCGKSTLLKLILGDLPPLSGPDSVWKHHNLRIAFVPQHHADVLDAHAQATPVQYLMETFHITTELKARAHLGAFGLTGAVQLQPIGSLSGGQKARLSFACVTWNRPHVIIMDEPTNHLDLESIEALAAGLRAFEGAVLLVSHNAAFMQAVCNELWVVERGSVTPHKQLRTSAPGESDSDDDEDAGFALFFEEYKRSIVDNIRKGKRVE
jgi:ATP-binding cassette, subfamily F, member 3